MNDIIDNDTLTTVNYQTDNNLIEWCDEQLDQFIWDWKAFDQNRQCKQLEKFFHCQAQNRIFCFFRMWQFWNITDIMFREIENTRYALATARVNYAQQYFLNMSITH